jgi:hypothetical protein
MIGFESREALPRRCGDRMKRPRMLTWHVITSIIRIPAWPLAAGILRTELPTTARFLGRFE